MPTIWHATVLIYIDVMLSHGHIQYCAQSSVLSGLSVRIWHKGSASSHIRFLSCTITVHSNCLPICCFHSVMARTTRSVRAAIAVTITTVFISHTSCLWRMPEACSRRTDQLNAVSVHAAAICSSRHMSHLSTLPVEFISCMVMRASMSYRHDCAHGQVPVENYLHQVRSLRETKM